MRVLGIDPGLTRCGVGVVEGSVGKPLTLVDVGVVRTGADQPIEERLCLIEAGLEQWLDATRPDAVAVERVFSQHNVQDRDGHRAGQRHRAARRRPPRAARSRCTRRARSRPPSPAAAGPTRRRSAPWSRGCCG